ncbi:testis-specific serine/threonine-protein kinase 4-like [Venturia canescens]|uniref:testis-specific serine/threonine-protein kinase 4-like n=1 Tax=Venturia canescens TaxID=32260 RepID=UPI001C9C338D|nr:testis-specific serine/threonine-protein kinase 4-like [Venturia canescens]
MSTVPENDEKKGVIEGSSTRNASTIETPEDDGKANRKPTVLESHGYALGRTIGAGSYATVKVAKSNRHECQVAVKIVSKFQAPEDYLRKFLPREIEVVKGLKHPHLIRFLQAIETTHRVYIIMEFAVNGSLLDIICRDTFIDESRSRRWFRQLTDAVDYCHERGVVHRDIKCENLLMDQEYNIKLSDFGFARGQMKPKNGVVILSETFCGSYAYASPEILRGIPYQPQLSDAWSLGVVLYAMVYGCLPFDDTNFAHLLKQVQSKVTFPKAPKISSECRSLIMRILMPQKTRIKIADIRSDPWLAVPVSEAETSTTEKSLENVDAGTMIAKELRVFNPQIIVASPPLLPETEKMSAKKPRNIDPSSLYEPESSPEESTEISPLNVTVDDSSPSTTRLNRSIDN